MNKDNLKKLLRNKGVYILLTLSIAIIGVSGYVSNYRKQLKQVSSSLEMQNYPTFAVEPKKTPIPELGNAAVSTPEPISEEVVATNETTTKLILPLQGEMICEYHGDDLIYSKTMQDWRVHKGIDISGAVGTQVKAAADGTVSDVFVDEMMGATVVINHGGGMETVYCNLQEATLVEKGQAVKCGDVIGGVGVTAQNEVADPPHLHFEVSVSGKSVDPFQYMS